MTDIDPFDADETNTATPAAIVNVPAGNASASTPSTRPLTEGDVFGRLDVDALVTEVSARVVTQHIESLARAAMKTALTPERIAVLEERAAAAVQKAINQPGEELIFGSVDEWLRKYWRYTYRRRVSGKGSGTGRWKAVWWNTDEAVQRLETLWRGWESARLDPGLGTSTWWINHATPHMTALLAIDGPFASSTDENAVGDPLPYAQPPAHLFPPDKQA